jgi:hypothetical protein
VLRHATPRSNIQSSAMTSCSNPYTFIIKVTLAAYGRLPLTTHHKLTRDIWHRGRRRHVF